MVVVAAAKPHVAAIVRRHNAILRAAHARIDGSLEEKLAALIQPILEKAGNQAAARFQKLATNHLTAALHERADQQALQRIAPGLAEDGFFGYRLRPFALTASAPTPSSAMICVKPRPDEAAEIAWPDGETAESLHVTLVYLGPVDGSLQEIADALAPVAASHAPLEGVVGGVGKFQPPGVAILLPDVPGLVELRVAVTEALVEKGIFYSRDHGFEAHVSIDAAPDPDTLEEALARTAQKPLHFDSILIVRGDSEVVEVPLIGPRPVTASGLCARCNGVGGLGQAGEICRDGQLPTMACSACSFAFSLAAAGEHVGWTGPAGDELIDVDKLVASLRTKTDPVRMAVLKSSMGPALKEAGISFDVSNPLTAKVLAQSGSQVKGIAETTQLNVMRIIDRSYNQGLSIPDTAKAIKAGMASASGYRARTIARTELAGAANGGSLAATMLAAGALGIGFYKQWLTAPGAPHPRHEDYEGLDGQTVGLEDAFDVGGENLQFPGDPDGSPEETINCFPGSTLVVAPGARVGFRRRYEGDLVRLEAQGVGDLSGTPNHPILTSAGWKPLGLLREGDYLVCAISRQGEGAVDPDVDHAPASIHQVFGALAAGKVSRRVRGLPVQFHGDLSADGEVEVVAADCDLGSGDDTALREQGGEFQFARAGLAECPLARASLGLDLALGGRSAAPGDVGGGGQLSAISGAGLTHPHAHRLGTGARRQTDVAECSVDDPTSDPVALGESLYGSSCEILLAQVVRVERSAFAGDVYNLQTDSGTYVANGIITHNCRCALAYTETPPEGAAATAEPEGGLTDEGVSQSGTTALDEAMPLTAPAGDTVSVNSTPFVPSPVVDRIKALGLDKPLKDVRPTTDIGREVYARGPTTEDLFKQGGEWTPERQQIHADIVAKHFEGKTPPVAGSPKTAIFTSGGGASGKGSTMIDIGDRHFPLSELEDHPERFPDVVLMNPDIIKAMLPEYEQLRNAGDLYAASGVHEESSAIGKVVAEMAQRQGYNVVIDTTGSSSSFVGKLEQAVKDGYEVKVRMVSIPTNEAVVRAMARGDRSGRYVAIDPLKGAHRGASGQLAIWKDMPNLDWQLFDNTDGRVLVAEKKAGGEIVIHDQAKLDQILAKANETSTVPSAAVERITAAEPATGPASEALVQPVTLGRAAGGPEARDALAAIDKVHTLPPLRTEPVPVTSNPELRAENGARLVSHSEGAVGVIPDRIEINPMGTHIELDVAHEVGHEIDYSLLQQDRGAVIEAAHTTDAWKNLEKIDTTHGEYLRRDREVFARAYAQWIAERSGNEAMLRALDNYAEDAKFGVANQQWTREDFAPVAAEFDKLFGDRGLLLVTPPAAPVTTAEAASAKLATATAAEPTVTPSLVGIAEQTGGRMEGLDFRVKGQASMERKISADVAEAAQDGVTMTPEEAAARINDALRYTMVFPDANYTEGVTQALAKLKENGFEQIKLKNFWGNPDYQGINGVFEKNGQRIELQFHTPMSFKVKEGQLHPLFEKYRVSTDPSESGKLWVAMEKASASVPQPVGVQSLGTLERHAPPSGLPVPEPALVADTRTVAEIVPGPDAETLAHVQSYQQTRLDDFAANYPVGQFGNSVNEIRDGYRAAVDQKIADLTAAADVQIRVTPHILDKIVDDGRFKSQFEVEHSGGAFNRTLRSQAEQTMFGYSRDLPVEERPIYGYLSGSTSEDGSISQYGPIIIRLTDAAANRATFTLTDSLGAGERRELAPVALADGQAAGKTDAFSTYTTKDPLKATSLAEISDVYAEAQVHGGVTLADIAEVILPKEEIAYRLEGLNRDIGLLEDRVAREQRFIDIHGEAAAQVSARQSIERLSARLADYQAQAALLVDDAAPLRAKLAAAGIKATLS